MKRSPAIAVAACLALTGMHNAPRAWRLIEEVRIGPGEEGPASFSTIRALTVDAAGRIYVLENQPQDIRVFSPTGQFVRHIGRLGAGPGEYRNASAFAWDSLGRLLVVDEQHVRNTWYDTAGAYVASSPRLVSGFYGWNWGGAILNDGRHVEQLMIREGNDTRSALAVVDAQGRLRDTVALPGRMGEVWQLTRGTRRIFMQVPHAPQTISHLDPRGFIWIARTDRYRVAQVTLAGDTVRIVERKVAPVPVTRREVDSIVAAVAATNGAGPDIDASKIPATKPLIRGMMVDDEGRLWVKVHQAAGETGTAFDVFDRNGRFLDRAVTPLRLGMYNVVRRGMMYSDARNEDDVPFIVRLRIAR